MKIKKILVIIIITGIVIFDPVYASENIVVLDMIKLEGFSIPTVGSKISKIVNTDTRYKIEQSWTDINLNQLLTDEDVYENGKNYSYNLTIIPNDGYSISEDLLLEIIDQNNEKLEGTSVQIDENGYVKLTVQYKINGNSPEELQIDESITESTTINSNQKSTKEIKDGWIQENGYTYYYEAGKMLKGIYEIDGKWYHFGQKSGQLKIGWSNTTDYKYYYSDKNGIMKFGWQTIEGNKYYFTKDEGEYKGIYEIDGKWYHFGQKSGQLKTGWSNTTDYKYYYSDNNGVLQLGWQTIDGNKYYFTMDEGKYTGKKTIDGIEYTFTQNGIALHKWVNTEGYTYYYKDGEILKGFYEIDGKWYHFGQKSGQLKIGWSNTTDYKYYYSDNNGVLQFGWLTIDGNKYYFTKDEGEYKGIYEIDGKWYHFGQKSGQLKIGWSNTTDYKYYYSDNNGVLQLGWQTIEGNKYYFTKNEGEYKGIYEINGKWYHFGQKSGQLKIGWSNTTDYKYYYSDNNGVLQLGWQTIDGNKYYFTKDEGEFKGIYEIDGKWYHFGQKSGQLKIGWSNTADYKYYYSDNNGVLQLGWQTIEGNKYYFTKDGGEYKGVYEIDGKWYHFGQKSGQLKIGWSNTTDYKFYYSNKSGELLKGIQLIDGDYYRFNDKFVLQTGWQEINGDKYYFYADGTKAIGAKKVEGIRCLFDESGKLLKHGIKIWIDVSYAQGKIDWDSLWASGDIDGVIIRMGSGSYNEDSWYETNIAAVKRLNIPYTLYYFSYAENETEALNESKNMVNLFRKYNATPCMNVYYDIEYYSYMSHTQYQNIIETFINYANSKGIGVKVYANKNFSQNLFNDVTRNYVDWIAHYTGANVGTSPSENIYSEYPKRLTDYYGQWRIWQYSNNGHLIGINGRVDLNVVLY